MRSDSRAAFFRYGATVFDQVSSILTRQRALKTELASPHLLQELRKFTSSLEIDAEPGAAHASDEQKWLLLRRQLGPIAIKCRMYECVCGGSHIDDHDRL